MNQEIIDKLIEKLNNYSELLKAHANTGANIEFQFYSGYINALDDARLVKPSQFNELCLIADMVRILTPTRPMDKDIIRELVNNALK